MISDHVVVLEFKGTSKKKMQIQKVLHQKCSLIFFYLQHFHFYYFRSHSCRKLEYFDYSSNAVEKRAVAKNVLKKILHKQNSIFLDLNQLRKYLLPILNNL